MTLSGHMHFPVWDLTVSSTWFLWRSGWVIVADWSHDISSTTARFRL